MVLLTSVGISAELWAGHVSWRCASIYSCSMLRMRPRNALLIEHGMRVESASQPIVEVLVPFVGNTPNFWPGCAA